MKVKTIRTIAEFALLENIWKQIHSMANLSIFQSFDWNYEWFVHNQKCDRLFILVFFEKDISDCKAIFPTYIDQKGCLRFIADIHSDIGDFLCSNCSTYDFFQIMTAFSIQIANEQKIRRVHLMNMSANNDVMPFLLHEFPKKSICLQSTIKSQILMDKEEEFPSSVSIYRASHRKQILKNLHKFSEYQTTIMEKKEEEFPWIDLKELRDLMIAEKRREYYFLTDEMIATIHNWYNKGLVMLHTVRYEEKLCAINIILKQNSGYQFWIDLYQNIPHINLFSINSFIQHVGKKNICIGFGRGYYGFKVVNFLPSPTILNEFYYSKSISDFILFMMKRITTKLLKPYLFR